LQEVDSAGSQTAEPNLLYNATVDKTVYKNLDSSISEHRGTDFQSMHPEGFLLCPKGAERGLPLKKDVARKRLFGGPKRPPKHHKRLPKGYMKTAV